MTDEDKQALADLALRALDTIHEDYGDDAELLAAGLVFEVRVNDDNGEGMYHGNYKCLEHNSPHHLAGLFRQTAKEMLS